MGLLIEDKILSALFASSHMIPRWRSFVFAASCDNDNDAG